MFQCDCRSDSEILSVCILCALVFVGINIRDPFLAKHADQTARGLLPWVDIGRRTANLATLSSRDLSDGIGV